MTRQCGDCQLCCKLLAVDDGVMVNGRKIAGSFHKDAGQRCPYQRHGKGCTVYNTSRMPACCSLWNCRWLVNDDTAELGRPDRTHYVIDILPDFITAQDNITGRTHDVPAIQVWVDPAFPDAHRDPALRAYLQRRAAQDGMVTIIRYSAERGFVLAAPALTGDGEWREFHDAVKGPVHTLEEKIARMGGNLSMRFEVR